MENRSNTGGPKEFLTVRQLSERFPAFPQGSIRWLIFNADRNGLNIAIVRVGRKVLIDSEKFIHWIEAHQSKKAS